MSRVEQLATWAAELALDDVPAEVLDLCRAQRRSVLAAVGASTGDAASRRVIAGIGATASDGPVRLVGTTRHVDADSALYAASALSVALDFDDYACFGHTGHSAVLVPLIVGPSLGADGATQLVAQVAANEIEARLGGACLIGPLNGQLWSFIHAAGAAVATARLLGLDAGRTAHALALALYQAPRPTVPGFMAPDSKLLTAAEPTAIGVRAARLAAAGVTGPLDVLEHPQGFFSAFAYTSLPALLDGLGQGWATRTLSIKAYPGCAYIDTAVDATLALGPVDVDAVESITVDASVLTCEMDALSRQYAVAGPPTPVTVNFSLAWNVAIALVAGQLTPVETDDEWLATHHEELRRLAERVVLRHDWALTMRTAEAMAPLLPPRSMFAGAATRQVVSGLRSVRKERHALQLSAAQLGELGRALRSGGLGPARRAARRAPLWSDDALREFAMTFPARVRVTMADGSLLEAEADVPLGGAGCASVPPAAVAVDKLAAWSAGLSARLDDGHGERGRGGDRAEALATAIDADRDDVWALATG